MNTKTADIRIETHTLEDLIGGIYELASSIQSTVFDCTANYYHEHPDEAEEWFCDKYSLAAGAVRLICASAELLNTALDNGDVDLVGNMKIHINKGSA